MMLCKIKTFLNNACQFYQEPTKMPFLIVKILYLFLLWLLLKFSHWLGYMRFTPFFSLVVFLPCIVPLKVSKLIASKELNLGRPSSWTLQNFPSSASWLELERLETAISQSQKEKGDERICIAKENAMIAINFWGSQPFKRTSVCFMNVFKIFQRGMRKHG